MKLIKLLTISLFITAPTIALSDVVDTSFSSHEVNVVETETPTQAKTKSVEKTIEERNIYNDFFYGIVPKKTSFLCEEVAKNVSESNSLFRDIIENISESCHYSLLDSFKPLMAFNKSRKEPKQIPELVFKLNTNLAPEFCEEIASNAIMQIKPVKIKLEGSWLILKISIRNSCLKEISQLNVYEPYVPTRILET